MAEYEQKMQAALLLQEHYITTEGPNESPDNLSGCICGKWSEGAMEPDWDDHLVDVLWDAGWRPAPTGEVTDAARGSAERLLDDFFNDDLQSYRRFTASLIENGWVHRG